MIQIILQPNGRFSLWCTNKNDLLATNATPDELTELILAMNRANIKAQVTRTTRQLAEGKNPYGRSQVTWEKLLELLKQYSGQTDVADLVRSLTPVDPRT
jgi:hypothetical protein